VYVVAEILHFVGQNPAVPLFLILGLGLLIGKIKIGGIPLGGVTGVLFVGLAFGHYGFELPASTFSLGFILFIFCVGVQAGPQFVGAFKKDGVKYVALAVIAALTATTVALILAKLFHFPIGMNAGALAGALTSTPTLVAAQDAVTAGLKSTTAAVPTGQVLGNISAAYAVTYVFGLAGLIIFMSVVPKLFRLDVPAEAQAYESEGGAVIGMSYEKAMRLAENPSIRAYRIEKDLLLNEEAADRPYTLPGEVQRVKRGNEVFTPDQGFEYDLGDVISVVGTGEVHEFVLENIGPEVFDLDVLDRATESRNIMVSRKYVAGKTLAEMQFVSKYQCTPTKVSRSGVSMPRRPDLQLRVGDIIAVTGPRSKLDALAEAMGSSESDLHQTDLLSFAFGIAIGVVIGTFSVTVGGIAIGLGTAGGSLLAGLGFGILNTKKPTIARFPTAARNILMELGLMLFMAGVAVSAGAGIVETVKTVGMTLGLCGIVITLCPVIVGFVVGRYGFKMNAAIVLGAITGAMTSTPALNQVTKIAKSSVPTLGYVGTYAFANVLLAIAGTVIMLL
jgi:putative transport protein